jgi:inositol-phosphate phosphatase/L-galactose 1-phosphate phosphatase
MSALDLEHCLEVAKTAALAAGAIIRDGSAKSNKHIEQKSSYADLVTETDKRCEDLIRSMLKEHFPNHEFIGEETAALTGEPGELTDGPTWMVRHCILHAEISPAPAWRTSC